MSEVKQRDRVGARTHLPQGQPPARRDAEHARGHPAHHRAADPRHVPRQPRPRLPHPRHRDAHLRNRAVQWAFRVRRLGRRARTHHRARPVRGGRPRLRPAQLHDRGLRLRGTGRRPRSVNDCRRPRAGRPPGRPDRSGARTDLPAVAASRRPTADTGRIQAAPLRQRLRRPAEDRREAVHRRADLRPHARRDRGHRRRDAARTPARRRGVVHPRLRRDGGALVADPHGIPLGALPRPFRPPRARRRELALPPQPPQGRRRSDGVPEAAGGAVLRSRPRAGRLAKRGNRTHPRPAACARRRSGTRVRGVPGTRRRRSAAAVAAHRCGTGTGIAYRRGSFGVSVRPGRRCAAYRRRRAHRTSAG